jgi:hypothetical protein
VTPGCSAARKISKLLLSRKSPIRAFAHDSALCSPPAVHFSVIPGGANKDSNLQDACREVAYSVDSEASYAMPLRAHIAVVVRSMIDAQMGARASAASSCISGDG